MITNQTGCGEVSKSNNVHILHSDVAMNVKQHLLLDNTIYDDFHPLPETSWLILRALLQMLQATNNPAQVWSSPSMHALYTFACRRLSSDQDAYPLKDASKFPSHYLWLLWSTRWTSNDGGGIMFGLGPLCDLMSQAITDPTSNYQPEDAILSVEHFVASSGVIGEAELHVFFRGLTRLENDYSSIIDDPARLLFFASLTLKLCQRSNLPMPKIFSLLMDSQKQHGSFYGNGRLLCIYPLLHSLSLKTASLGDNTVVHALEMNLSDELSPELELFISSFCSELPWTYGDTSYGVISVLSLLPALHEFHLVANRIIRRLRGDKDRWRGFFEYCDEHGESV
jgi:hypothetical protein